MEPHWNWKDANEICNSQCKNSEEGMHYASLDIGILSSMILPLFAYTQLFVIKIFDSISFNNEIESHLHEFNQDLLGVKSMTCYYS